MAALSTIRLIIGALEAPEGSQLKYFLIMCLGLLFVLAFTAAWVFFMWYAGSRRAQLILAEDANAPVALVGGLAEDSNEVLNKLGASHSFPKPERILVSFGATAEGLHVYRRFGHRVALLPADHIDEIRLERRALATGPEREVMTFTIRDEADAPHRLSFAMFSPGKLCMIPYSKKYMQNLLAEFREALGVKNHAG